jgi:hypothetical protein
LIAVDTAAGGAADDWIQGNTVRANTAACTPSDDIPLPLSGLSIAALGTSGTTVEANRVTGNSPTLDAPVSGGIVLASSGSFDAARRRTRSSAATSLRANTPADLVYDGSGQNNRLTGNGCETSVPDCVCR